MQRSCIGLKFEEAHLALETQVPSDVIETDAPTTPPEENDYIVVEEETPVDDYLPEETGFPVQISHPSDSYEATWFCRTLINTVRVLTSCVLIVMTRH